MPALKYCVRLAEDERKHLIDLVENKRNKPSVINRAQILLKADESFYDKEIARSLNIGMATIGRVRKRYTEGGLSYALYERPNPRKERVLDEQKEEEFVRLVRQSPPNGNKRWTLRLLASHMVKTELVGSISHETVRLTLQRLNLSL